MVTKPRLILCLALVLPANSVFARSDQIHVLPNLPPDWHVPVSVQSKDSGLGKHFTVFLKDIETNSDQFVRAKLEVSSEDNQIASCPVLKEWTTNGIRFEFTVSAAYLQASEFSIYIYGHIGERPMPSFTDYWFYLRDFVTNNTAVARQPSSAEVAPEIIEALPKRIRSLRSGTTAVEVWNQLNLATYKNRLSMDRDGLGFDRYRLSWNYSIEFTFEKTADGKRFGDDRKLIRAVLYKNGLEICNSDK